LLRAGALADVKRSTGRQFVEVAFDTTANGHMPGLNGFLSALSRYPVKVAEERADGVRVELLDGIGSSQVLQEAIANGPGPVRRFEVVEPSLQEIFINAVRQADPQSVEQVSAAGGVR